MKNSTKQLYLYRPKKERVEVYILEQVNNDNVRVQIIKGRTQVVSRGKLRTS
jgi:hypothetical protein